MILTVFLLVVFLVHLAAFIVLGLRRRQPYYLSLVLTFSLLSGAMAARLFLPGWTVAGDIELAHGLRMASWAAAVISIAWTLLRIRARRLRRRRADA
ncbi:MAG: hypothetical protein V5A42_00220 [Halofilum sp. (in: g-proteobacteria)]